MLGVFTLDPDRPRAQRGSADCKNTLIGILAALDKLVEEGFQPERYVF